MVGMLGVPSVAFVPQKRTLCPAGGTGSVAGKFTTPFWHAVNDGPTGAAGFEFTVTATVVIGLTPHPIVLSTLT